MLLACIGSKCRVQVCSYAYPSCALYGLYQPQQAYNDPYGIGWDMRTNARDSLALCLVMAPVISLLWKIRCTWTQHTSLTVFSHLTRASTVANKLALTAFLQLPIEHKPRERCNLIGPKATSRSSPALHFTSLSTPWHCPIMLLLYFQECNNDLLSSLQAAVASVAPFRVVEHVRDRLGARQLRASGELFLRVNPPAEFLRMLYLQRRGEENFIICQGGHRYCTVYTCNIHTSWW